MKHNGRTLSEKELIKEALDHISEACCFLFETDSPEGHALAFMCDSLLKYGTVIKNGDNPLAAAADYTEYENKKYQEFIAKKEKEKKLTVVE